MDISILKQVALAGELQKSIEISTAELAGIIKKEPGAVSRQISKLVDAGLLSRELRGRKQFLKVTSSGEDLLANEFREYCQIFASYRQRFIRGKLVSGLGEGQYYISQQGYIKQFVKLLGFKPFPGTLNLQLGQPLIEPRTPIRIEGFINHGRTFGAVRCYPAQIRGIIAAVIRPERTHYPVDFVEVISPVNLRKKLELNDGDLVELEFRC